MIFKDKLFSKEWFKSYFMIIEGALIAAAGYNFFLIPHKIIPGGLFGISTVVFHLTGFPVGILTMILNIPLLIIGVKILGPRFGVKTVIGMALLSFFNDGMHYFWPEIKLSDDMFISCLVGGTLIGAGIGLIFKAKATTGGVDIIGQVMYAKFKFSTGKTILFTNAIIIFGGAAVLWLIDPETQFLRMIIYAIIANYASSKTLDTTLEGASFYKGIFIISDKYEEIKTKLLVDMKRGGTIIPAKGMFHDDERKIIFTTVSRRETAFLKDYLKKLDPKAFIVIFETNEVYGHGFLPIKDMG
jgi:uncharacterized membrane-anchored protein YitT (DUF2179 family)